MKAFFALIVLAALNLQLVECSAVSDRLRLCIM